MKAVLATAISALSLLFSGHSYGQPKVEILFNQFAPPGHIIHTGVLNPLFQQVQKGTSGRVVFKVPGSSLAPPPRQLDAVNQGIFDGAYIFNPFLQQRVPLITVSLLPLLGDTAEGRAVALWRTYQKFFAQKADYGPAHVLGFVGAPSFQIFSLGKPINSVDDLKGLKLWSSPATSAEAWKRLGITVVTSPVVGAYELISGGTVDAIGGLSFNEVDSFKISQFAKSASLVPGGVAGSTFSVFISQSKWNSISKADQGVVMEIFGENLARQSRAWDSANVASRRKFEAEGKPVMTIDDAFLAKLKEAWMPMHAQWVKAASGLDGRAALAYYAEQVKLVEAERR